MSQVTIGGLPNAVTPQGSDLVPVDQLNGDGTYTTRKLRLDSLPQQALSYGNGVWAASGTFTAASLNAMLTDVYAAIAAATA